MRILLITDWMRVRGGVETYVTNLRDGLEAAGDEVRLLTSSAGAWEEASSDYLVYGTERIDAQVLLQIVNPSAVARLTRALREFRPDLVQVHMFAMHLSPAIFAPLRSIPTLLVVSDYKPVCPTSWKLLPDGSRCTDPAGLVCWRNGCTSFPHWLRDRPRYALIRAGLRHVDRILACGRSVQRELEVKGIASEVLTLPVRSPGRDYRRVPAPEPVFVYCGRLSHEKGLTLLLHSFARVRQSVPRARLRLVGAGPERDKLERLARELQLREAVSFQGWLPPERLEHELEDAWALVAPSLHAEPLGLVAIEAIIRGVPVIASAMGGFAETVEHGVSGLLFPNGAEEALASHLESLASGRAFPTHEIAGEVVRRVSTAHSIERHLDGLRQIYTELVAEPPPVEVTS
jgi:glycosyltransferase involved in cell wall biosynthesis